ncbi:MAG TPA: dihydrolipoamide acetyltransferase family protein [Solirubrobacteraceae bacterium]|nr:dihydrolipoamide acetyltransferase family protein [Solirubrobacteraceae bacterium]
MTEILMPKLSEAMEQGTILSWLKSSGDQVEVGDELLEIETDKATVAHAAEAAGELEILVAEGTTVPVGASIARIGEPRAESAEPGVPAAFEAAVSVAPGSNGNGDLSIRGGVPATPIARRIAAVHGISLDAVRGTGPLGRITRADVLNEAGLAAPSTPSPPPPRPAAPDALATTPPGDVRRELSHLQRTVAQRMTQAKATIPHFQVQTEVTMDEAIALRSQLIALGEEGEPTPSLNDLVVKAAALALRRHPLANASYHDDEFVLHDRINIGIAVTLDGALIVPTVFDAAGKSLGQLARETQRLAERVRSGEITPAELEGATFTVSNLGMFGMTAIFPVINPPQAAILGVGSVRQTLAREGDEIVDRRLMTLTLSCDHRIIYGADAARFLGEVRGLLETPLKLSFG